MGVIVGDEGDAVDGGAALGGEACAFDVEVLDQDHGIACGEGDAVAVFMVGRSGLVVSPYLGFFVEVELLGQIAGPVGVEAFERAQGEDLEGRVFGPHSRGDGAEMVGRCLGVGALGADRDGGVSGAACDGGVGEGRVSGAEGAGHLGSSQVGFSGCTTDRSVLHVVCWALIFALMPE